MLSRCIVAAMSVVASPAVADVFALPAPLGRYEARTLVTGTDLRSRPAGMAACLADVLAKVSGDAAAPADPRVATLRPEALVADYDYVDRMGGLPHRDEQGSSDRPFWLTVRFDPARLDVALGRLDRVPYEGARPPVMLSVVVRSASRVFLVDRDAGPADHRAAALAAADRVGLPLRLPTATELATGVMAEGSLPVSGTLVWSDAAHGWVAEWHAAWGGRDHAWGAAGVSFDEAYRVAMRGALGLLAGYPP